MPQVPYQPVPDVSPQNIPSPSFRIDTPPAAFGVNVGQAIQHLGTTAEQVGGELFNRAIAIQQLRNETEATQAAAAYDGRADQTYVDFENTKRGLNAVNGEADHRKAQQDLWQNTRDSLSNPMAQRLFDGKSLSTLRSVMFSGARHAAAEGRTAYGNSLTAELQSSVDRAENAKTEEDFQALKDKIDSSARSLGDSTGQSPEWTEQTAFKWKSAAIAKRIEGLRRTDTVAARKLLDQAIEDGSLHGNDRNRAEAAVHSAIMATAPRVITEKTVQDFRDPESYLAAHSESPNVRSRGVDPAFGQNLVAAGTAYKAATGKEPEFLSLKRTYEEQAEIRARHEAMPGGVEAHPAAIPGTSRHESGRAADIDPGFTAWLKQIDSTGKSNADKYGLEFLKGRTGVNDPNHVQLAGDAPLRQVRTYDINERDFVNTGLAKMREAYPNASPDQLAELSFRTEQALGDRYRKDAAYDHQEDTNNYNTILRALQVDNPPKTLEDLFKQSPQSEEVWHRLPPKDQNALSKIISKDYVTDVNEYNRFHGMSTTEDSIPGFISQDTTDAIKNSNKLSKGRKLELLNLQDRKRAEPQHDPTVANAWGRIRYTLPEELQKAGDLQNQYKGALQAALATFHQVYGKPAGPADIDEIGQRLLQDVKVPAQWSPETGIPRGPLAPIMNWWYSQSGRRFEVAPPPADYDRLKKDYTDSRGFPPSDEKVKQMYIVEQFQKLYPPKGSSANRP